MATNDRGNRVVIDHVDGREITRHAARRWRTRSSAESPVSIKDAWKRSIPVGCDSIKKQARLYPPDDILILYSSHRLHTAVPVGNRTIDTAHLKQCTDCGQYWNPAETDECPWCDDDSSSTDWISVTGKPGGEPER